MYNFRRQIFEYFVKQGLRVCVVSPFDEEFTPKIDALGCEFIALEMEAKGVNPIKDFGVYTSYRKIMRSIKPDFCFFYTIKPNIYGSFAATSLNIPHIAITTGLGYTFINNNIVSFVAKKLYKLAFRKTKQVWFLNKDDEKAFLAEKIINKNKAYVMQGGEGVDLTRFEKTTLPTDVSFLLLARMLWDKGILS